MDYEYLAGFFDGEGYIKINRYDNKRNGKICYFVTAQLSNTNETIMNQISEKLNVKNRKYEYSNTNWNPVFRISTFSQKAYSLLDNIKPYSIIKLREIDIVEKFRSTLKSNHYGFELTNDERKYRDKLIEELKSFHGSKVNVIDNKEYNPSFSYIAGFLDAEGSIMIIPDKRKIAGYGILITMPNTHKPVLESMQRLVGGRLYYKHSKSVSPHYVLTFYGKYGIELINKIKDFLIIKKEQSEICLLMYSHQQKLRYKPLSKEDVDYRESLYKKIKTLNQA